MGSSGKWGAAGEAFLAHLLLCGPGKGVGNPALEDVYRAEQKK